MFFQKKLFWLGNYLTRINITIWNGGKVCTLWKLKVSFFNFVTKFKLHLPQEFVKVKLYSSAKFYKNWLKPLQNFVTLTRGRSRYFEKVGALYVGHHGWPTKKLLGFRWSKKAKITLETKAFGETFLSVFSIFLHFYI